MLDFNGFEWDTGRGDMNQNKRIGEDDRHRRVAWTQMTHGRTAMLGHQHFMSYALFVSLMRGRVSEVTVVQQVLDVLQQFTQSRHQRDDKHNREDLVKY